MSNVRELYREIVKEQEAKHVQRARMNTLALLGTGIPFIKGAGGVLSLRDPQYPKIDYNPGQQKWAYRGGFMMGNAEALLDWLGRNRRG